MYDSKCPILSPTLTRKKGPFLPSLKKVRCVTREEKLFQTRVRCFQHLSMSRAPAAPSTPTRAEHLTLARNSSFSPLVAQYTIYCYWYLDKSFILVEKTIALGVNYNSPCNHIIIVIIYLRKILFSQNCYWNYIEQISFICQSYLLILITFAI